MLINLFRYTGFRVALIVVLSVLIIFPVYSAYAQFQCLPTCDVDDARFFVLVGVGQSSLNNSTTEFGLTSPAGAAILEFGVFDGNRDGRWDVQGGSTEIIFTLFADPDGDGSETLQLGEWSGDIMPDNDWFDITVSNNPAAQNLEGNFSYKLIVTNSNPAILAGNVFKIRVNGSIFVLAEQPFNIIARISELEDIAAVYPSFDIMNPGPACLDPNDPAKLCDESDPSCCLNDTTYSGTWTFFLEVPEGITTLDIWDGDFDFGSSFADDNLNCFADGVSVDTDDPNTPDNVLPPWAIGTTAVFEGVSTPTDPFDDICSPLFRRRPSVIYNLTDPAGNVYTNDNPSGTEEWELFSISTDESFNPAINDLRVQEIPAGVWRVDILGTDLQNLNALRFPFALLGADPEGGMPTQEVSVPTLSEWGLFAMAGILGMTALFVIRKRKLTA